MSKVKTIKFVDGEGPIEVGQTVYVNNGQGGSHNHGWEDKVEKIGNKYVTLGRDSFAYDGKHNSRLGCPYRIYSSKAAHERMKTEGNFISEVNQKLRNIHLTYDQAVEFKALLEKHKL